MKFSRPFQNEQEALATVDAWADAMMNDSDPPVAVEHLETCFRTAMRKHAEGEQCAWPLTSPEVVNAWLRLWAGPLQLERNLALAKLCRDCKGTGFYPDPDQKIPCPKCNPTDYELWKKGQYVSAVTPTQAIN